MDYSKVVTFTNTTDFDFTPEMGAMFGGIPYPVAAGQTKLLLYDLADHLAHALAKQILLKQDATPKVFDPKDPTGGQGATLWTPEKLDELAKTMLGEAVQQTKEAPMTEAEKVHAKVEELNKVEPEIKTGYKDKAEVIAELKAKGIKYDARSSKATLEKLLV